MGDKFVLLLLLLIYLTNEILAMLVMACLLSNGHVFFAIIEMFCLHYYAAWTTETFEELIGK